MRIPFSGSVDYQMTNANRKTALGIKVHIWDPSFMHR